MCRCTFHPRHHRVDDRPRPHKSWHIRGYAAAVDEWVPIELVKWEMVEVPWNKHRLRRRVIHNFANVHLAHAWLTQYGDWLSLHFSELAIFYELD